MSSFEQSKFAPGRLSGRFSAGLGLAALLLMALCSLAAQAVGTRASGEFLIDHWETGDGLPENSATAMVQTGHGYLWFGTFNGIVRFDGVHFRVFDTINTPDLPHAAVVAMHLDRKGGLWVGTYRGVACLRDGRWQVYNRTKEPTPDLARTFAETPDGALYISTMSGKVLRFSGEGFTAMPQPPGTPSGVYQMVTDADGRLCAAQGGFVGYWSGTAWKSILATNDMVVVGGGLAVGPAQGGGFWLLSGDHLIKVFKGREALRVKLDQTIAGAFCLTEDRQGRIWAGSYNQGLYLISTDRTVKRYYSGNGLSYDSMRFVFEDAEGDLWVGTSGGGLMRFKARRVRNYGVEDGLPERIVSAVAAGSGNSVLAATYGKGATRMANGAFVPIPSPPELGAEILARTVLEDRRGVTWVGSYRKGLYMVDKSGARQVPVESSAGLNIAALFEDSRKRIWIGANEGVALYEKDRFKTFKFMIKEESAFVHCFAENPATREILAGCDSGLVRFMGDRFEEIKDSEGRPYTDLQSIKIDRDGTLWLGTMGRGLMRARAGKRATITEQQGLPAQIISSIFEDEDHTFWLGSNRGIIRAMRRDLEAVFDGTEKQLQHTLLTVSDGMASVECANSRQPTACRDSAGRLWFATLKGVAMIDPRQMRLNTNPPPVLIESVMYRDEQQVWHKVQLDGSKTVLPAGSGQVQIQFTALSFSAPEKMKFVCRLSRSDKLVSEEEVNWAKREVNFALLPPGEHVFQVTAVNSDGFWDREGATLRFHIEPFLWQTWWFRAGALLLLAGASGGVVWQSTERRVRIQREKAEMFAARAAAELDRRQAEMALRQSEEKFSKAFQSSPDPFAICTQAEGRLLAVNEGFERLLGYRAEEVLGRTTTELGLWANPDQWAEMLKIFGREGRLRGFELELRCRNGELRNGLFSAEPIDLDGQSCLVTVTHDITERKRMEDELARREKRFRSLIENASDLITVINKEGVIRFQSASVEKVLGFTREELLGSNVLNLIHPEDTEKVQSSIQRTRPGEVNLQAVEYRVRHKKGAWRLLSSVGRNIPEEAEEGFIVINSRDITESRKLEEQFRQTQKMEAIGQLSGGVAHDFNNLLTVIQGHVALLESGNLSAALQESTQEIGQAAERAANLTRQLLAFSRRQAMQPRDLDLNEVVAGTTKMLQRILGEDIRIQLHFAPQALYFTGDAGMIDQILLNLAVNSRDAMPSGGKLVIATSLVDINETMAASVPEARPGYFACLTVSDSGCGIAPEVLPRIFEPFYTTKDIGRGTGLGLATVYGIVQQHRGWIRVFSEVGRGTTFTIYFPRVAVKPIRGGMTARLADTSGGNETILLVEDEPSVRALVRRVLTRCGYHVLEASNGQSALEVWQQCRGQIRLLFTDIVMPDGISGADLARRLLKDEPKLRVIYTSGYSAESAGRDFVLRKGDVFLAKPFEPGKLAKTVRAALDGRGM